MDEQEVKELIAEMEARVKYFEICIGIFHDMPGTMQYFHGKKSEAHFIIEKLKAIFE